MKLIHNSVSRNNTQSQIRDQNAENNTFDDLAWFLALSTDEQDRWLKQNDLDNKWDDLLTIAMWE